MKDFFYFFQGQFFVSFFRMYFVKLPDVAGFTPGLAYICYRKRQIERHTGRCESPSRQAEANHLGQKFFEVIDHID
jgi:hypothetical protein